MDRISQQLFDEFRQMEHDMKRGGFLKKTATAEADWVSLAKHLGNDFFDKVSNSGVVDTLIKEPPRALRQENGKLEWLPEKPKALANVHQLLVEGVCRVRNNLFHGEKFMGAANIEQRDAKLVVECIELLKLVRVELNAANKP